MKHEKIRERMGVDSESLFSKVMGSILVIWGIGVFMSLAMSGLVIWLIIEAIGWLRANS